MNSGTFISIRNPTSSPRCSFSDKLSKKEIEESYYIVRELGKGTYGKVILSQCKQTGTVVALKALRKTSTKFRDFQRELTYSYFLSPHFAIVKSFDVAFESKLAYVFAQEYAPYGDLFDAIPKDVGLHEDIAKNIVKQISSALEFMHSKFLVHRDVKPENVLIFDKRMERVKLTDFGMTKKFGILVRKSTISNPYTSPEVCHVPPRDQYVIHPCIDIWALGVMTFCSLSGRFPWESANLDDCFFYEFMQWYRKKSSRLPSQWRRFTPKLMRLFRKVLDPDPESRCRIDEISKYLNDEWTVSQRVQGVSDRFDQITSESEADQLTRLLETYGVETKINKKMKERRTSDWVHHTISTQLANTVKI